MKIESPTDIEEYLTQFKKKTAQNRIPTSGSIELTCRCNLRCTHCYQGDRVGNKIDTGEELDAAQWKNIIDQLAEAGCFRLLITGGEPLIRKDFPEIYSHAKLKGLLVTVFTNGTLLNDETITLFKDLPPLLVEISLYGATPQTYEKITNVRGSYGKCIDGIQRLKNAGLSFWLKTPIMTLNKHEYYEIEAIAKQYDVNFYFDPSISPRFDGDRSPIDMRIAPEEAIEMAYSNKEKLRTALKFFEKRRSVRLSDKALYSCGSGLTTCHVTADGILQPCLRAMEPNFDLKKGRFIDGWRNELLSIRNKTVQHDDSRCKGCEKKIICHYCPPHFDLESGDEEVCSEYVCALANLSWILLTEDRGEQL